MKRFILARYAALFAAVMCLDRLAKWWVINHPNYWPITSWLSCDLSYNRGIAGGFLQSHHAFWYGALTLFIIVFTLGFFIDVVQGWRLNRPLYGEALVLAGALSNIYDRLAYGGVIDFISCYYAGWYFPTFNIADAAIVVGVIGMLVYRYEYS